MNKTMLQTYSAVMNNCNEHSSVLANKYIQKILDISGKEKNGNLDFLSYPNF